jgi:release factor glutamine methyltransferase
VAQWIEHQIPVLRVGGSSPSMLMLKDNPNWQVTGIELWAWYQFAVGESEASGIGRREVDWLLQAVSDVDRLSLQLGDVSRRDRIVLNRPWVEILDLWQQRLVQRKPMQYLVGSTPWRDFDLQVSGAVLIPRPETELLIDLAMDRFQNSGGNWLDLGTGSGAIAIGLAAAFPRAQIHGVDFSAEALVVARSNAERNGLIDRIQFYQGFWWQPIEHLKGQCLAMVSNPPYIPTATVLELAPEVVNHEPHLALDGGVDGLRDIRVLVDGAPDFLVSGGWWAIEMMAGQGKAVVELLEKHGAYRDIQIVDDWAGFDRFVVANRV